MALLSPFLFFMVESRVWWLNYDKFTYFLSTNSDCAIVKSPVFPCFSVVKKSASVKSEPKTCLVSGLRHRSVARAFDLDGHHPGGALCVVGCHRGPTTRFTQIAYDFAMDMKKSYISLYGDVEWCWMMWLETRIRMNIVNDLVNIWKIPDLLGKVVDCMVP